MTRGAWMIVLGVVIWSASFCAAQPGRGRAAETWGANANSVLDRLAGAGENDGLISEARSALLTSARAGTPLRAEGLIDAALAWRLSEQLSALPERDRRAALSAARACPEATAEFVFAVHAKDDAPAAWKLFVRLVTARAADVERHGALAGAIALVHENGYSFRCNENEPKASDPLAIFEYYANAGRTLIFRPADMPLELLTRVVDSTASPDDMRWATTRHPQGRDVGQRFHDVAYDYNHLATGRNKKVTTEGFTLQNIQKHGGVCADQAYYACGVGKALGVPTAYVFARGNEAAHAWVGYFRLRGRDGEWDFKEGRYDAYLGVRGWTQDPQTREYLPDGALAITASLHGTTPADRRRAAAWADASRALASENGDVTTRLTWLENAVKTCPGVRAIWDELEACAGAEGLPAGQASRWIDTVRRTFGASEPDFLFDASAGLLRAVSDPRERANEWQRLTRDFARRPDLLSAALMGVGQALEDQGQKDRALNVYQDVITKYTKDGLAVSQALRRADELLSEKGREGEALRMYDLAWRRLPKPDVSAYFWPGSAWFSVGGMYAARLHKAGELQQAERVLAEIGLGRR